MTTEEKKVLKSAEALVRDVLKNDLKQRVSPAVLREVALKVSRAIPTQKADK